LNINLNEINAYIHAQMPITPHLGASISLYDGQKVVVSAPLAANLNHHHTAFGGSLSAFGILSGWALLFIKLKEIDINCSLVIQKSAFEFLAPITCDFEAVCIVPPVDVWDKFIKTLRKHGRARITVASTLQSPTGIGGTHEGVYVATLSDH